MSSAPQRKLTSAEYLEMERASEHRNIFWRGDIFAMSGATRQHVKIAGNIFRRIHVAFDENDCEVMQSDMRVKNERTDSYFYPDVVATCKSPKFEDDTFDTLLNPQVIIEVLSDSTEAFDRGDKFQDYKRLESLSDYVLVSQKKVLVERFTRLPAADASSASTWTYWSSEDPEAVLELESIDCKILLKDIYSKVDFAPEEDGPDDTEGKQDDLKVVEEKAKFI